MIIEINEYLDLVKNKNIIVVSNLNKYIHTHKNGNTVGFINIEQNNKSHDTFYLGQNMAKHGLIDLVIIDRRKENTLDYNYFIDHYAKNFKVSPDFDYAYIVDHDNGFYIEVEE